jgi:SAM-dependent methyltransferase
MEPKPEQWSAEYGGWFADPAIAEAYPHRPPYPPDAIELLATQAGGGAVLDVGCGTGDLARYLAPSVGRVDAVDPSEAMLGKGKRLPGGDHPHLNWQQGYAETAALTPPYTLVTAGESLHWMDWPVVLPRFAGVLAPGGVLAIADRDWEGPPALGARLTPVFARFGAVGYRPLDLVAELESRGLFAPLGEHRCGPVAWRPTVDEYLQCRYSQRGFSRTHLGPEKVAAFDRAVRDALDGAPRGSDGRLELTVEARVTFGRPVAQ